MDTGKATSIARVITGKPVEVVLGDANDTPHTNLKKIVIGCAIKWDPVERFGVLIHEICHILFPAKYPAGNMRNIVNAIDDCRIERQFHQFQPCYKDALVNLAVQVIANDKYNDASRWDNFDPGSWVVLYFRSHLPENIRQAALDAVMAHVEDGALFNKLCELGHRITRLSRVSTETLKEFAVLYFTVFPNAKREPENMAKDGGDGVDKPDEEGDNNGPEGDDGQLAPSGAGSKEAIEALKEAIKEAVSEGKKKEIDNPFESSEENKEEEKGSLPGVGSAHIEVEMVPHTIDSGFLHDVKSAIRRLICVAEEAVESEKKTGKLNFRSIIRADSLGMVATKPFKKDEDLDSVRPVACAVCTDFSGSTEGDVNYMLNNIAHNVLFALQSSGCENTHVAWNCGGSITKKLDEKVQPLLARKHESAGGTDLNAAAVKAVESLKTARSNHKVCFIFTDGAVGAGAVEKISQHFADNGFKSCLLISVGEDLKSAGLVTCKSVKKIEEIPYIFKDWVVSNVGKAL